MLLQYSPLPMGTLPGIEKVDVVKEIETQKIKRAAILATS